MTKKILFSMAFVASVVACTDDYKDWTTPQVVSQPTQVNFTDGSVTAVDVIKFADIADDQQTVKVCNLTAPTATDAAFSPTYTIALGDATYALNGDGTMSASDLISYVEVNYGKAPTERSIDATVSMWLSDGSATVKTATSNVFQVKALPDAPVIESAYYYVGAANGWGGQDLKLTNGGGDVYADPVFSVVVPAQGGDHWFKIMPESAYSLGNIWDSPSVVGVYTNGTSALSGTFIVASNGNDAEGSGANSWCIKESENPGLYYRITLNMLEFTYEITPINYATYIYEIGNSQGWSTCSPLYCAEADGKYEGFAYLDGGYKFKPNIDNWDGDWGQKKNADKGILVQDDEEDCSAEAGFYVMNVDLAAMTYSTTKIEYIDIVGGVEGGASDWSSGPHMTYNTAEGCWEADVTLTGAFKFRGNGNWDNADGNFGGTLTDIINGSNDNLEPTITGAPVHIKLFLSCNTKSYAEITAK